MMMKEHGGGIEMRGKEKSTDLVHYTAKNTL